MHEPQVDAQQLKQDNSELQHQLASLQLASPRPRSPLKQTPSQPSIHPSGAPGPMQQSSSFFQLPQVSLLADAPNRRQD